jgi:hypothetical protein
MAQLPEYRVYFNGPPLMRMFGCVGCLAAIFFAGGMAGLLLMGWKYLLGL